MKYGVAFVTAILISHTIVLAADVPTSKPALIYDQDVKPLAIGGAAPDFNLPGVDGRRHALKDYADAKLLVIVFTCNHCPTAQAYEDRIKQIASDYAPKGVALVAISPNDPKAVRLDELGYTDMSDSFDEMKVRAKARGFNFPYLYDGENQQVSRAYGPPATPTVYIFDSGRKLQYFGRVDDSSDPARVKKQDARAALDALLAGKPVPVAKTKAVGCSTKWSGKRDTVVQAMEKLAAEPVGLDSVDLDGLRKLLENKSEKLILVNFWATWCTPCLAELPELITMSRMYRHRGFELVTISCDEPARRELALKMLNKLQASNRNLFFGSAGQCDMIEAVDKDWTGALPYTALIAPGGKVVYRRQGPIEPLELRRLVVAALPKRY